MHDRNRVGRRFAGTALAVGVMAMILSLVAMPAGAQGITIDAGSRWQADGARHALDCTPITNAGQLEADSGAFDAVGGFANTGQASATTAVLRVGGDWSNSGAFAAGQSSVQLVDACSINAASITGTTSFSSLSLSSNAGKLYAFEAGATQSVQQALVLAGGPAVRLVIRSTSPGVQANLALATSGTQSISRIDVADMRAPDEAAYLAQGMPHEFDSIDSGNNTRWFGDFLGSVALPTLSGAVTVLLALLLAALAWRHTATRQRRGDA